VTGGIEGGAPPPPNLPSSYRRTIQA